MNFKENITLKEYSDESNRQFGDFSKQLQTLETDFDAKMGGKTLTQTIGSMVGTGLWIAFILSGSVLLIVYKEYLRYYYDINISVALLVTVAILFLVLFTFMLIDEYTDYSFCKKIVDYQNVIVGLEKRLESGNNSIQENGKAFDYAETLGFNYTLVKAASMQEEATKIGEKVSEMVAIKEGFITEAKNVMYYVVAGGMTLLGFVSLYRIVGSASEGTFNLVDITDVDWEDWWYVIVLMVAIIAIVIGEVLLVRFAWSKSNCKVTNVTVFTAFAGTAVFVPLSMLLTVILYFAILLLLVAVIVGFFCVMGYLFAQCA